MFNNNMDYNDIHKMFNYNNVNYNDIHKMLFTE